MEPTQENAVVGQVVKLDFGAAAMLYLIEAVQRLKPSAPMSAEARARAEEGMQMLRQQAAAARAELSQP